ncbi:hypothetical protein [Streptomyces sp. NPDC008125]|uniref:hypothetical protein n=1 Tax=Streptomyces sp. NPDC008125 TaxID=3364811 RepID=UPI0036E6EACE
MTIDAMHWVWTCSRAKGNVRLVMLAVADKATGPDCTARMGTSEFVSRVNAARSSVVKAVDSALSSGELMIVDPAVGSRAATYQLPFAVSHVRPAQTARGPETGPVGDSYRSGNETPERKQGSGTRTGTERARGPESGPEGSENETSRGPTSGPLNQTTPTRSESKQAGAPAPVDPGPEIPAGARPLVDALTTAGVLVRWNLSASEWSLVEALTERTGVPALAAFAQRQASAREISFAKYFLPGWRELPPLPAPGPARPPVPAQQVRPAQPVRPVPPARHAVPAPGGWQPYTNPVDPSVYENGF